MVDASLRPVNPTDPELVARVITGDDRAWEMLVDRYAQAVWRITGNYGFGSATREDISQTVWLRLFDRIESIRQPDRLIGWLAQVTRNECINVSRHRQRNVYLERPIDLEDELVDMTANIERELVQSSLAAAFYDIDLRCRELLVLCLVDPPLSYDEISEQLGMPKGSIGPTRRRCLDKLRQNPAIAAIDTEETQP